MPIRKHMNRFTPYDGIVPQMDVPMNISDASRMAARRPIRSAITPQKTDPTVVPLSAQTRSHPIAEGGIPYSATMPGSTKPSVAGFMTSITSATPSTNSNPQCAGAEGGRVDGVQLVVGRAGACRTGWRNQRPGGKDHPADDQPHPGNHQG